MHAQIKSRAKLFSSKCRVTSIHLSKLKTDTLAETWTSTLSQEPNTRVSVYDAAFPGTLPVRGAVYKSKHLVHDSYILTDGFCRT